MSIADFYEGGQQKQNKAHLENLISIALVDGKIVDSEKQLLAKFAKRLSIDTDTFNEMLKGVDHYAINPPTDKKERFNRMYNLLRIALVDHELDNEEIVLLHKYAIGLGYSEEQYVNISRQSIEFVIQGLDPEEAYEKLEVKK